MAKPLNPLMVTFLAACAMIAPAFLNHGKAPMPFLIGAAVVGVGALLTAEWLTDRWDSANASGWKVWVPIAMWLGGAGLWASAALAPFLFG